MILSCLPSPEISRSYFPTGAQRRDPSSRSNDPTRTGQKPGQVRNDNDGEVSRLLRASDRDQEMLCAGGEEMATSSPHLTDGVPRSAQEVRHTGPPRNAPDIGGGHPY